MKTAPRLTITIQALVVLFFAITSNLASAQIDTVAIDNYATKAPFFKTFNVEKLTAYLVEPYASDAEKVRSISTWIGTHIKYDLDVLRGAKYKGKSPKNTLRKRKAICEGYAELFRSMCDEANIEAYAVNGYDKGAMWERDDEFIRDNHAWNSVRIDGDWYLLDLTWFAGKSVEKKRAIRRWMYYKFSIPFTPKYKFHFARNEKYYLADPHVFIEDHAPDLACWQLLDTIVPIEVFEMDSVTEFFENPSQYATDYVTGYPYKDSVRYFTHVGEPDIHLLMAKSAHWYNPKNNRILAEGNSLFAQDFVASTAISIDGPQQKIDNYDSAIVHYKIALDAYRLYSKDCRREYKRRKTKNAAITKDALTANKAIISDLKKQRRTLTSFRSKAQSNRLKLKGMNSATGAEQGRIDPTKIERTKSAKAVTPEMLAQRVFNDTTISMHSDSVAIFVDSFNVAQQKFSDGIVEVQNLRFSYTDNGDGMVDWVSERTVFRKYWSWNDTEYYLELTNLINNELQDEKQHFANFDSITANEVYATAKSIRSIYRQEKKQLKAQLKLIKKNKKLDSANVYDQQYEAMCEQHSDAIDRYSAANDKMMAHLSRDRAENKFDRKKVLQWIAALNYENKLERKRNRLYNRYYLKSMVSALKAANRHKSSIHKQISYTQKLKRKSKDELRKLEQELKNQRETPTPPEQNILTVR